MVRFLIALCSFAAGFVVALGVATIVRVDDSELLATKASLKDAGKELESAKSRIASLLAESAQQKGEMARLEADLSTSEDRRKTMVELLERAQAALIAAEDAKKRENQVADATIAPVEHRWREVKRWQVNGDRTTEVFRVSSRSWKLVWPTRAYVGFGAYRPDGTIAGHGSSRGGQSDTLIHEGPGDFYLELSSTTPATFIVLEVAPETATPADFP